MTLFIFRSITFLVACAAMLNSAFAAETFSFDLTENRLRIVIPDIPQMKMAPHPLSTSRRDMRFMGTDASGYSISIITPTADAGMGPKACASSSYKSLLTRYRLDPDRVMARQVNDTTFIVLFPFRSEQTMQFKAYILSGYGGDHCIDVHVSKAVFAATKEEATLELKAWLSGFSKAVIAPY